LIEAVLCNDANAHSGRGVALVRGMADEWTEMQRRARESMTRLHELIAAAHALNETLDARGIQHAVLPHVLRRDVTCKPAAQRGDAPCF
jgi:hypothetical protein